MAAVEEEIELTEEQKAEQEAYERVFFSGEDHGESGESGESGETTEDQEADQGHQEPEDQPDGSQGDAGDQTADEDGNVDGEIPAADQADNEQNENPEYVAPRTFKIKWNGEDLEVTEDELVALGQKGFDYTSKMQNISRYRKELEAAGVNDEVLDLMKRVRTGDKAAALRYLNQYGVDPIDLISVDEEVIDSSTPRKTSQELVVSQEVAPLIEQVLANPSLQSKMERAEAYLPRAVINRMAQNADLLYLAVSEVESGSFDQVMPRVQMRMATMSDLDREYVLNSPDVFGNIYAEEKNFLYGGQQQPVGQQATRTAARKPNMAEVGVKKTGGSVRKDAVIKDAFTDDTEYQKILERVRNQR